MIIHILAIVAIILFIYSTSTEHFKENDWSKLYSIEYQILSDYIKTVDYTCYAIKRMPNLPLFNDYVGTRMKHYWINENNLNHAKDYKGMCFYLYDGLVLNADVEGFPEIDYDKIIDFFEDKNCLIETTTIEPRWGYDNVEKNLSIHKISC